jgi:hypothetical protein
VEHRAGGYRSVVVASGAFIHVAGLQQPTFPVTAAPTNKTIRPPEFKQGPKATLFIRKLLLPLPKNS